MSTRKLGILGFGTVGSGVYESLEKERKRVETLAGFFTIPVVVVKDASKARATGPDTLVTDRLEALFEAEVDTVVEAVTDAEEAYPAVRKLLQKGISVISANKELIARHGEELHLLAAGSGSRLFYEAAVAGGIPILTSIRHTLKTNRILRVEGIVNGTSNFILTKMREEGTAFEAALEEATALGYAEAVPDKDIDGWDAWFKTTILSFWINGAGPEWTEERPQGIRGIDVRDLHLAEKLGGRIKHVASLEGTKASVGPKLVLKDHALYGVEGVNNGVYVEASLSGPLLFQGPGAGKFPTAGAVIEDVINHWTNTAEEEPPFTEPAPAEEEPFPYWFITGSAVPDELEPVSRIVESDGKYGAVVRRRPEGKALAVLGCPEEVLQPV
ncbi:homoserine dehydrogenase [Alkalicoccus luteus]|uniref:Homoserine dehydrogenase n=1 Tax=Alkalicoccus luteus TaxID=1237094 RepID=A0A969PS08_9BACI|nr:homoserine dehydrogenase [Alkalicoccus luteus]NJP38308.1 homoserine dehydrogenase [Alkalicoccus luteus]